MHKLRGGDEGMKDVLNYFQPGLWPVAPVSKLNQMSQMSRSRCQVWDDRHTWVWTDL